MNGYKNVFQRGDSDEEKVGRFVAGSSLALAATVFTGTMSFVWAVVMQRLLGPEGYGLAFPFLDMFWLLSMVVSFGAPQAMQTFVSHHHQADPVESVRVMAEGTRLLFLLGVAMCVPAAVAALAFGERLSPLMRGFTWLMLASLAARQMYLGMFGALGGIQRIDLVALCNILFPAVMMVSSVGLVLWVRRSGGSMEYEGALAAVAGIPVGTAVQYAASLLVGRLGGLRVVGMYRWKGLGGGWKLLTFGAAAAAAVIAGSAVSFIPPALVSRFAHGYGAFGATPEANAVQAGYFSGAYTYAKAPMLIVGMLFALLPAVSEAHAQGNRPLMQRYFDLAVKYALTVIFFVLAVYAALAGPIIEFFGGAEFPAGELGTTAFVLAAGMSMCMFMMLLLSLLIGLKRPGVPAAAAACLLALEGAALAGAAKFSGTILAEAAAFAGVLFLGLVFLVGYTVKATGLQWKWIIAARPFAAALGTALLLRLLPGEAPLFLLSLAAAAPVYICLTGILGGVDGDDFDMVREMLKAVRLGALAGLLDVAEKLFSLSPLYGKKQRE